MKEKLNKYTKRSSKLNQDNVRLSNENKLIKQELNGLKQEHGRSVGDKDGLMHQVKILSLRLSKSVSKMDEKKLHQKFVKTLSNIKHNHNLLLSFDREELLLGILKEISNVGQ